MWILSAYVRAFHLSAGLQITQFILHRLYMHMYFFLIYAMEMLHKTNSIVLILLSNMYTFSPDSYLLLGVMWLRTERKKSPWLPSLSFYVIISRVSNWLTQGSEWVRKFMMGSLIFHVSQNSIAFPVSEGLWWECKSTASRGCQSFCSLRHLGNTGCVWPCCWSIWMLCTWSMATAVYEWGSKNGRHATTWAPLLTGMCPPPIDFT